MHVHVLQNEREDRAGMDEEKKNAHHLAKKMTEVTIRELESFVPYTDGILESLFRLYLSIEKQDYKYASIDKAGLYEDVRGLMSTQKELQEVIRGLRFLQKSLENMYLTKEIKNAEPTD